MPSAGDFSATPRFRSLENLIMDPVLGDTHGEDPWTAKLMFFDRVQTRACDCKGGPSKIEIPPRPSLQQGGWGDFLPSQKQIQSSLETMDSREPTLRQGQHR